MICNQVVLGSIPSTFIVWLNKNYYICGRAQNPVKLAVNIYDKTKIIKPAITVEVAEKCIRKEDRPMSYNTSTKELIIIGSNPILGTIV